MIGPTLPSPSGNWSIERIGVILVAAAAEERLVGHVELGAIDLALDDAHAQELRADQSPSASCA